jgi:hypothetical protein
LAHCAPVGYGAVVLQAQTLDMHTLICGTQHITPKETNEAAKKVPG